MNIKRTIVRQIMNDLTEDNTIFGVVFIKKNGEVRRMRCRKGVKKHLHGGKLKYNPKEYDLLTVFDMDKKGYRSIPISRLQELNIHKNNFQIVD